MIVKFIPEAEKELREAFEWYSSKKIGLEKEFLLCIDEAISRIKRNPELFPKALKNSRKIISKRFPYVIYYLKNNNEIIILAVFHSKQNPKKWQKRV